VPPSAVADIEDELRAFLSDAPPPETKSPSDVPAEIISEGIESVPEAPDLPPLVVPQRSKPPVPPPRAGVLPSATFHPAPVISDAPPVATARGKAPPLPPKTAGGTLPSPVITTTGAGPSAPPLVPKGPPPKSAGPLLIDVTPLSLGVETVGGFCDVIIRANSPVPCDRSRVFQTASDNQTSVVVKICQGESERFAENTTLGDLRLSGFRPAPRGEVAITVLFEIDADGILNVQAKEVSTGRSATARIELLGAQLDAAKVQAMMNRQAEREVA
jgi:molecular chaperone DnaK